MAHPSHVAAALKPKKSRTREGAVLAVFIVGAALGIGSLMTSCSKTGDAEQKAVSAYIPVHQCVVAQLRGRGVETYRCDVPMTGQYLSAEALLQAALKEAAPPLETKETKEAKVAPVIVAPALTAPTPTPAPVAKAASASAPAKPSKH